MNERTEDELRGVTLLGNQDTKYKYEYDPKILEAFQNKNPGGVQWITLNCCEFTSICPRTGQPDTATIYINYIPNSKMVESKSLKLYLFSFRNHGSFHEDVIQTICNDLYSLLDPKYIEVKGDFLPRGGISIDPFSSDCDDTELGKKVWTHRFLRRNLQQLRVDNR